MVDKEKDRAFEGVEDKRDRLLIRSKLESESDLLENKEASQNEEMTEEWRSFYSEVRKAVENMRL